MIVVAGKIGVDPEKMDDAALAAMETMQAASQAEAGCMSFQFYTNPWDDAYIFVFEEWESIEALQAHGQTEHMKAWREAGAKFRTGDNALKRYEVSTHSNL